MIPDSWFSLVAFGLLVTPGLVFELLEDRSRAIRDESTFREISRTVLYSVVFAFAALPVTALISWAFPHQFATPGELLRTADSLSGAERVRAAWTFCLQCGVSSALAVLWNLYHRRNSPANIKSESAWTAAFRTYCPDGHVAMVRVSLEDGTAWEGMVDAFSADFEHDAREVVLRPPLRKYVKGTERPLPDAWQAVVLRGSDLQAVLVRYVESDKGASEPKRGWRRSLMHARRE